MLYRALAVNFLFILLFPSFMQGQINPESGYRIIDVHDFYLLKNQNPDAVLIDVRTYREYRKNRLKGALFAGSPAELEEITTSLGMDQPLLIYCHTVTRSYTACDWLVQKGFRKVYLLEGGIESWEKAGLPMDHRRLPRIREGSRLP